MAVINNKTFDKTYDKLVKKLEQKVYQYTIKRRYGGNIDYCNLKKLLLFSRYLDSIKNSKYDYYYVNGLTQISNYLNKI